MDNFQAALAGLFGHDVERAVEESLTDPEGRGVLILELDPDVTDVTTFHGEKVLEVSTKRWDIQLSAAVPYGEIHIRPVAPA